MKKLLAWVALILPLVLLFAAGALTSSMESTYDRSGHALYRAGAWLQAADAYSGAISWAWGCSDEGLADLYCDRGDAYDMAGRLDDALADYDRAQRIAPQKARPWFERGVALQRARRYREARADMDKAIALHTGRPFYYFSRAEVLLELGEYRAAITDLDTYINGPREAASTFGRAYRCFDLRGWAHHKLGEHREALADFERALSIKPDYGLAWEDKAAAHTALGETALAREASEKAKTLRAAASASPSPSAAPFDT